MEKTRGETAKCVPDLQVKINDLEAAKESTLERCKSSDDAFSEARQLEAALASIEEEHRRNIHKIHHESRMTESELQSKLDTAMSELAELEQGSTSSGESSENVA